VVIAAMTDKGAGSVLYPLIVLCMVCTFWSCDPFGDTYDSLDEVRYYTADEVVPVLPDSLLPVMTWNIKFGGGRIDFWFDCYGDRVLMTEEEVISNLQGLADLINEQQPAILLLQEVDVNAKRSAYIDQVQWLLDHTHLNYGAYASHWQNQFIPSDGLGPMDSGNAVLSVFPLSGGKRIPLPLRSDQDAITRHFYLKRNILRVRVDVPLGGIWVLNVHTSAYAQDGTKKEQLDIFKEETDKLNNMGFRVLAGGDLNEIPPGSVRTHDFPDSVCEDEEFLADDYSQETGWLLDFYNDPSYYPAIALGEYVAAETPEGDNPYYTHTTDKYGWWTRKLDYLFSNLQPLENGTVLQNTMTLSDHAPVTANLHLSGFPPSFPCGGNSCEETGCPDGMICDVEGCYPSVCECMEDGTVICTDDCGGSACVPEN
jgi:endonuclease/exonuclease/phosphatase family metal-dependent hydrolase